MYKYSKVANPLGLLITLSVLGALGAPQVFAAQECCSVVAIDATAGTITLRDDRSGKVETVTVKDRAKLAKLVVGQRTDHVGQHYCSISSFEPCLDQVRSHNCQPCPNEQ